MPAHAVRNEIDTEILVDQEDVLVHSPLDAHVGGTP
jgi:hypothetical protein